MCYVHGQIHHNEYNRTLYGLQIYANKNFKHLNINLHF